MRVLEVFVTSLTLAEFESQVNKWFKLTVFFSDKSFVCVLVQVRFESIILSICPKRE